MPCAFSQTPFHGEMLRDSFLLTVPALLFMRSAQTAIRQHVAQGQARLRTRNKHTTFGKQTHDISVAHSLRLHVHPKGNKAQGADPSAGH